MVAAYGPNWQTPDPSFTFARRRPVFRRIAGWLGALRAERDYWEWFYDRPEPPLPEEPSRFAFWVSERDDSGLPLADIGHGNGRDAVWFAAQGRTVTGLDCTWGSLRRAGMCAAARGVEIDQWLYNLAEMRHALVAGARLAHIGPHVVYARMLIDAVRPFVRHNFWRLSSMATRGGGRLYLEYRADPDSADDYVYGDHNRYPVRPDVVTAELVGVGATIVEQVEGRGFAPLGGEDPYMCRMVVEWR
jgi:hypothetical protein